MLLRATVSLLALAIAAAPAPRRDALGVAVVSVSRDVAVGQPYPVPADGVFWVVTLAITGDARFQTRVVDERGQAYQPAHDVDALLPERPSGVIRLVFDLADHAEAPILELRPRGLFRQPIRVPLR